MKKQIDCILLIDDDYATNYFHQIIIADGQYAKKVIVKNNGAEALEYLKTPYNEDNPRPNLIFLDINMPRMTGWEFLDEYHKLTPEQQAEHVIVMLSTSSNPTDLDRADQNPHIKEYRSKPISDEMLIEVIERYWAQEAAEI